MVKWHHHAVLYKTFFEARGSNMQTSSLTAHLWVPCSSYPNLHLQTWASSYEGQVTAFYLCTVVLATADTYFLGVAHIGQMEMLKCRNRNIKMEVLKQEKKAFYLASWSHTLTQTVRESDLSRIIENRVGQFYYHIELILLYEQSQEYQGALDHHKCTAKTNWLF